MIWKSCERFGICPPGIKPEWDDNNWWYQGLIIAYNQIREHEENDILQLQLEAASMGKIL